MHPCHREKQGGGPQNTKREPWGREPTDEKKGKAKDKRKHLPTAGPAAKSEPGERPMQIISHAFIQLRLAGDIIGNHQPAGIKWTTGKDRGKEREC